MPPEVPNVPSDEELAEEAELKARFSRVPDDMTERPRELGVEERKMQERYPEKQVNNNRNDMMKQYGMTAAITVLIVILMSYVGLGNFATKSYAESRLAEITATVDTAITNVNNASTQLNTQISTMNSQIDAKVTTGVSTATNTLNNSISNLSSKIDNLNNSVSTLTQNYNGAIQSINSMQSTIDTLEGRIVELETEAAAIPDEDDEDAVAISVRQQSELIIISANQSVSTVRITVTNTTSKDIENIMLGMGVQLIPYTGTITSVSGGATGWYAYPGAPLYYRTSGWGIAIDAGEKKTFDVIIYFAFPQTASGTGQYTVDAYVEDWDYAD